MTLALGILIIGIAVFAVLRRCEVRLTLLSAALAMGVLAGRPEVIVQKFFATFTAQQYLVPIGSAMGFAYVLRHTHCDQHLVQLLVAPLRRAQVFLIPGAVLVGYVVNIPIISQTSCAVAIGSVLIPLLLAARITPVTAGAALLLGASIGGELLNPGAPEFRTVVAESARVGQPPLTGAQMVQAILPLNLLHLGVATAVFWALSLRAEAAVAKDPPADAEDAGAAGPESAAGPGKPPAFRVNPVKAAIPAVPLGLLFLFAPPLELLALPPAWLLTEKELASETAGALLDSRRIGAAMIVGVILAALTDRQAAPGVARAFFEGAGYAVANVVSIIVAAVCFGEGVTLIGLAAVIGSLIGAWPPALLPAAGLLSLAFAGIAGSGFAATQSLFPLFAGPAVAIGVSPAHVGAVVSLGSAAGRTMSPVAAVCLMAASLTGTSPAELVRRVALPLLAGMAAVIAAAMLMTAAGWTPAR